MSSRRAGHHHRVVALLMISMIVSSCTGHVDIPREQFEAATHDEFLSHRIRTTRTEYIAHRFSFTDSTLVITELAPSDTRYRLEKPPFVIRRDELVSIAGVKSNQAVPYVVAIGIGALITGLWMWWHGDL